MKFAKRTWLVFSGLTWLAIGCMLLFKGLKFITQTLGLEEGRPLLKFFMSFVGSSHKAALLLICLALLVGFLKGRMILSKTVERISSRILSHPSVLSWKEAYDRKYFIILGVMVLIGMGFRFLGIPLDIRGGIDVAIGSALINGAMLYFRRLFIPQKA